MAEEHEISDVFPGAKPGDFDLCEQTTGEGGHIDFNLTTRGDQKHAFKYDDAKLAVVIFVDQKHTGGTAIFGEVTPETMAAATQALHVTLYKTGRVPEFQKVWRVLDGLRGLKLLKKMFKPGIEEGA